MRYIITCDTDIGILKEENQDAMAIRHVLLPCGEVVFSVLCDGMGGFQSGEVASSSVVMAYIRWFEDDFLHNYSKMNKDSICCDWEKILITMNKKIFEHGKSNNIQIGTTLTVFMIWESKYYILNVGDCRAYEFASSVTQLTKDHSFVAKEIEAGRMTIEDARIDSRRNQLLQCIGGNYKTCGDFYTGNVSVGAVYMLCCDGVRTKVNDEELMYFLHPQCMTSEDIMNNNIKYVFELNKMRNETDNMSIVLIKDSETTMQLLFDDIDARILSEKTILQSELIIC